MKTAAVLGLFCAISSPAAAEWKIDSFVDRMSDKKFYTATAPAQSPDQGISATLRVSCMNGAAMPSLVLSQPLSRGQIGVNWRLDNGAQRPSFLHVFADPYSIPFVGVSSRMFSGKKRFRITIFPTGSQTLFWDFDVSGANEAISRVKC